MTEVFCAPFRYRTDVFDASTERRKLIYFLMNSNTTLKLHTHCHLESKKKGVFWCPGAAL